jgi:hypothetical protein
MDPTTGQLSRRSLLRTSAVTIGAAGLATVLASPAAASLTSQYKQHDWRWCNYCQCLFYENDYTSGCCPRGCGHNWAGSGNYWCNYGDGPGQGNWCWCHKCEGLWYGGTDNNGKCPMGGSHSRDGSGNYYMQYGTPSHGEQSGWKWCKKCYCLCYSGVDGGHCAGRGRHDWSSSGDYYLAYGN